MRRISPAAAARCLGAVLAFTGTTHFATPQTYDPLIPPALPGAARWWTYGSGVAELGCALALAIPRTRRKGAIAAAAILIGVFPGNVWMAWCSRHLTVGRRLMAYGRLPLQVPLVGWALYAGSTEKGA
jgi:uncharacterized membrane protein